MTEDDEFSTNSDDSEDCRACPVHLEPQLKPKDDLDFQRRKSQSKSYYSTIGTYALHQQPDRKKVHDAVEHDTTEEIPGNPRLQATTQSAGTHLDRVVSMC